MSQLSRPSWARLAFLLSFLMPFTAFSLLAQTPSKVKVTIAVTLDDSPCPDSKVFIRPMGTVEKWPAGKSRITLATDAKGHATVELGAGKYLAIAHDPGNARLPSDGSFIIKPGQTKPMKIHLNLLYWDCSKVTCML
jgi:hypothetical protein